MSKDIILEQIIKRLDVEPRSIKNTISLIEDGATIPFIARYRKEATGSLDEVAIADISKLWNTFQELSKRKKYILDQIQEQGKLTTSLSAKIDACWDVSTIEDLYLPYKKKRKTKASVAKERGLEPLATLIMDQREEQLMAKAKQFLTSEVPTIEDALEGARHIIAELVNEQAQAREMARKCFEKTAVLNAAVVKKKKEEALKYKDYFNYRESAIKAPAHRVLAIFRAEKEGLLRVHIDIDTDDLNYRLHQFFIQRQSSRSCRKQLEVAIEDSLHRLLKPSLDTEFRKRYKDAADSEAIAVFSENLKQLLLAPPLGTKAIMGIDPGFRTGCKVVCLTKTGDLVHNTTIYPHPPQAKVEEAQAEISRLVKKYAIEAIAIGNGTAGKESYGLIKAIPFEKNIDVFMVNEAGASIYSASELAREEFPDQDVTVRGAISIARRLMDPLSELVKIDPKSIGVGQYQHDVNQSKLKEDLSQCVVSAVNAVGINLNTASEHVLQYVSGLGPVLAKNIVAYRSEQGSFKKIIHLKKVPRMGPKAFEQSAGFLRIRNGDDPLDNTGVHPERYALVKQIAKDLQLDVTKMIANKEAYSGIQFSKYVTKDVGLPTLKDIVKELDKPGLDIRGKAAAFEFTAGVRTIEDIRPGMFVKGIINNITKFGAFVDIGIKEAGLIHVSQMANRFVKDPMEIVKLNQEVSAKVIEVDIARKRISLSLKET